jgi:hypothetical protein
MDPRMIYQHDLKVWAAKENGVPTDTYFYMSYWEWVKVREHCKRVCELEKEN